MDLNIDLKGFFQRIKSEVLEKQEKQKNDPKFIENESHWIKCPSCEALMFFKEVENLNHVCPKCNHHMRIGAKKRIDLIADADSFVEYDAELHPTDPLQFVDSKSYQKRLEEALHKTGKTSAVVSGECTVDGIGVQLVVFDFSFMGGSLGSVEGEKIVRACNRAMEKEQGVIIVSASGGARMQESTFSLMQMAKTSAALRKLDNQGLPFISILTDPTFGGVSASFAFLGDIIMAEPGALVGFAGARVIKQTIGKDLPDGFQRAEFLLDHGSIDMVVERNTMKKTLHDLLKLFQKDVA
ncbi:acetyl-CoA carboxylase, carboxyltransferase subunit beta [Arcobacter sp. 15-2]|uniref:acetyl-CoA carboxylase, carboxyltransferase subunit beta n=1 Tax=Arcobacter sp. 15-2 TaxID=3374109 RepID=UPI00399C9339|eukprot:gnl/Dysnectes_brevis/7160_a11740_269.p1 GENE.gnl/Dysnectes_brevis/7160_a11740_269~~gnl/Dysnectes_brevis/7160_a11740_269.p1  ORF type:complete len:297 (-),score=-40.21 gnl/Dysnectes_brevis/7160_a11740_269:1129-2019(-)